MLDVLAVENVAAAAGQEPSQWMWVNACNQSRATRSNLREFRHSDAAVCHTLCTAYGERPLDKFQVIPHILVLAGAYALALPIGWDREKEARSAGLRTFPLVALASCGFVQATEAHLLNSPEATARIVEGLITGIGFIGGGAILKQGSRFTARRRQPAFGRPARSGLPWGSAATTSPLRSPRSPSDAETAAVVEAGGQT